MNPLEIDLTVLGSLRHTFVLCCNTTALSCEGDWSGVLQEIPQRIR